MCLKDTFPAISNKKSPLRPLKKRHPLLLHLMQFASDNTSLINIESICWAVQTFDFIDEWPAVFKESSSRRKSHQKAFHKDSHSISCECVAFWQPYTMAICLLPTNGRLSKQRFLVILPKQSIHAYVGNVAMFSCSFICSISSTFNLMMFIPILLYVAGICIFVIRLYSCAHNCNGCLAFHFSNQQKEIRWILLSNCKCMIIVCFRKFDRRHDRNWDTNIWFNSNYIFHSWTTAMQCSSIYGKRVVWNGTLWTNTSNCIKNDNETHQKHTKKMYFPSIVIRIHCWPDRSVLLHFDSNRKFY